MGAHPFYMPTIPFYVERPVECACLALSAVPFAACPECHGCGEAWSEVPLVVSYRHTKASRGARDRYGAQLEPDEEASVEVLGVTDERGREVELTPLEMNCAEERCYEAIEDGAARYAED